MSATIEVRAPSEQSEGNDTERRVFHMPGRPPAQVSHGAARKDRFKPIDFLSLAIYRLDKSRSPRSLMTDESGKPSAELGTCGMTLKSMRPPRFAGLFAAFANVIPFSATEPRCRRGDCEPVVERFGQHLATAVLCWIRSV